MSLVKFAEDFSIVMWPYSADDLQRDNPNTGFPNDLSAVSLSDFGAAVVQPTETPAHNVAMEVVVEIAPALVDGEWLQRWQVQELPADQAREAAKVRRSAVVQNIKVIAQSGRVFDGDETSQNRMVRAIKALETTGTPTTLWVLADNSVVQVTVAELTEALILAGQAQSDAWVIE